MLHAFCQHAVRLSAAASVLGCTALTSLCVHGGGHLDMRMEELAGIEMGLGRLQNLTLKCIYGSYPEASACQR